MQDTRVSPFQSRNFRLLFGSTAASAIGDWLDFVAILVLVSVVWDEGAFGLAAVSVAIGLPNLMAPLVGVYVDRSSPRLVMVTADLGRAAITTAMVFSSGLWMLVGLLALRSTFSTLFVPAEQTVIKQAVPEGSLVSANAVIQTVVQGFKVVGPAAGGLLLTVASPTEVIAVNAMTFAVSAVVLWWLDVPANGQREAPQGYWTELVEGVRFVAGSAALRLLLVAMGGTVFLVFMFDSMLALIVPALALSPSYIGYLISAFGLGGLVGAVLLSKWGDDVPPFVLIGAGQALSGAAVAVIGLGAMTGLVAPGLLWLGVTAAIGVAASGVMVGYPAVVQTVTPEHLMGRTWTALGAIPTGLQVLAPMVAAAAVSGTEVGAVFAVSGAGLVLLSGFTLTRRQAVPLTSTSLESAA